MALQRGEYVIVDDPKPGKEVMVNYTLRLPAELRELALEEAKAHGRDLAEELRLAIGSHYSRPWGIITHKDLEEALRKHEETFHMAVGPVMKIVHEPTPRHETLSPSIDLKKVLNTLEDELLAGREPTPTDLERLLGASAKRISRMLGKHDIRAKNTRRAGVSAHYYLASSLPKIQSVIGVL